MKTVSKPFLEHSRALAEKFLQTVVVLDDQAYFDAPVEQVGTLNAPGRRRKQSTNINLVSPLQDVTHGLDAKTLIDKFAEKGLICAVLKPGKGEEVLVKTLEVAHRADVLILDWEIYRDEGMIAKDILTALITSDEARLRLVIIYTGQGKLLDIIEDIRDHIKAKTGKEAEKFVGDNVLVLGAMRIVGLAKPGVTVAISNTKVPYEQLPARVIEEFSHMTGGLMANVALASLSAIRSNTHTLLGQFRPELDPAYLTHRAFQDIPEEAEEHLLPIIVAEIQAILEDKAVWKEAGMESITKWIYEHASELQWREHLGLRSLSKAQATMLSILTYGLFHKDVILPSPTLKKLVRDLRDLKEDDKSALDQLTNSFCYEGNSGINSNYALAMLMSIRSQYAHPPPRLTLGTIIAEDIADKQNIRTAYRVCAQPRCDSVRLDNKRSFPFLKMPHANDTNSFAYVVYDRNANVRLNLSYRPFHVHVINFKPRQGQKEIIAVKEEGEWKFEAEGGKKYRWVAELKPEHAQRVANDFAAHVSRVGLTESEWLRRWALKKI